MIIYVTFENIIGFARTHVLEIKIYNNMVLVIYAIVIGIAWWMILRGKPALKQWAIAANLIFIFFYLPGLIYGDWRYVLRAELAWWPEILIGVFGIIVFSIPYPGWRQTAADAWAARMSRKIDLSAAAGADPHPNV